MEIEGVVAVVDEGDLEELALQPTGKEGAAARSARLPDERREPTEPGSAGHRPRSNSEAKASCLQSGGAVSYPQAAAESPAEFHGPLGQAGTGRSASGDLGP